MSKITSAMAVLGVVAGLGVAALPLSSYAQVSGPVTIRTEVNSTLAVSSSEELVDLGTVNGTTDGSNSTVITVSGTVAKYSLGVMDRDNDNNMVWVGQGTTTPSGASSPVKEIPAITGNTLTGGWGFRVNNPNTTAGEWKAVPVYSASGVNNIVEEAELNNEAKTTVEFGVSVDGIANLENGIYEDQVVFTAMAKN